ncbi:alpha/beta hydrolase family protein [Agrilutibacter solisilvae]|uniref:Alpha/beta hydrolase n=1 Tax=Agrilutibacter solisilvae TaxID=2763317 RepID=A0A974Y0D7_9GAMM|nr:alpha/beta hydrolase [Lysobacter solisilvae]QSX78958.1 alpha/beta hydrolase [Lysobacter solisilvae]
MTRSRWTLLSSTVAALALAGAICAAPAFAVLPAVPAPPAPADFRGGLYQGLIDGAGELNPAQVQFTASADGGWQAQVRIAGRAEALPATVGFQGQRLTLALPGPAGPLACAGDVSAAAVVAPADLPGCRLELVAAQEGPLAQSLAGAWVDAQGGVYAIARSGDSPQPIWIDYRTGAWRGLVERDGALHFGPGTATPWPEQATLAPKDGALYLQASGGPKEGTRLQRLALREQALEWQAGDAVLKGTLILPAAASAGTGTRTTRWPAVILTHMSGSGDRDAYRQFAYFFAAQGVAALIYDRRGAGQSGGDEASAGMHRLADDAVAAAQALGAVPQIDPARIGTFGHSQGGWVAPIAAARSDAIAFVIAQAASGVSPAEQELFRVEHNARDAGLDEQEIAAAVDYERRLMDWVRTGEGRDQIHALARANRDARWARFVELREDLPERPAARSQSFWWFDPAPDLARVRVPVLVIHGDRDGFVPVERSREIQRTAFAQAQPTFVLLPRTAHGMWTGERDSAREAMRSPGSAPEYWAQLRAWLRAQHLAQ